MKLLNLKSYIFDISFQVAVKCKIEPLPMNLSRLTKGLKFYELLQVMRKNSSLFYFVFFPTDKLVWDFKSFTDMLQPVFSDDGSNNNKWDSAKNTIISPNFLGRKFCGKEQFPHIFIFHKISTPGNEVKLRYFSQWEKSQCTKDSQTSLKDVFWMVRNTFMLLILWVDAITCHISRCNILFSFIE